MREIKLTQGRVTLVDDEDFGRLSKYHWQAVKSGDRCYVCSFVYLGGRNNRRTVMMHRMIMNAPPNKLVDHIDHDGLNNQRSNLRLCTNAENQANRKGPTSANTSGFRGVSWHISDRKWCARIKVNGKLIFLGNHDTPELAHAAFDRAARTYFGEFYQPTPKRGKKQ